MRARIAGDVKALQGSLNDLTDSLERMRRQLRDIELQAETQIASRIEAAKAASQSFDPLEMDRFTRFQELTRMMAESVNDVATVQRNLQRTVEGTEDDLIAQGRQARELQKDLLRTRMVEFDGISDRLYRVVRQAGKDAGKQVKLTVTEFLLLQSLAQRPGFVKSRDNLMDAAYDDQVYVDDRTIDSHIKRMRKKFREVDNTFDAIETLYGVGYRYREA